MSLYFWNARLQNLIEPIDTSRLSKEQNDIYNLLCKQDVQTDNAMHLAQSETLYQDYEDLFNTVNHQDYWHIGYVQINIPS